MDLVFWIIVIGNMLFSFYTCWKMTYHLVKYEDMVNWSSLQAMLSAVIAFLLIFSK